MSDVKPDMRLSWSRLRTHDECPAKYDLMRRYRSPHQDVRNFFHGNVVDLAMRRYLALGTPDGDWMTSDGMPPGWMAVQVDALFEESLEIAKDEGVVKWRHAKDRDETREFCRVLVTRLEDILSRYCLPFSWQPAVRFEVPLTVTGPRGDQRVIALVGEMDLLVRDASGDFAIWDLKATRDNQYWRKVQGQLTFYSLVTRAMHGRFPVRTGLLQPMCDEWVKPLPAAGPDELRQMAGRIEKTARDVWAGMTAPKESNDGCTWCEVQRVCPKFAHGTGRVGMRSAAV